MNQDLKVCSHSFKKLNLHDFRVMPEWMGVPLGSQKNVHHCAFPARGDYDSDAGSVRRGRMNRTEKMILWGKKEII